MVGVRFCTILNAAYVPRWLTLHRSMTRHSGQIRFLVCCWDAQTKSLVERLDLPEVTTIEMRTLEDHDADLAAVRTERSFRAHRSGAKASLCRYIFDTDETVDVIVYLDADLMFFADASILIEELGEASILLVPQRHPPNERRHDEVYGVFQAGTLAFTRHPQTREALAWWRKRCLEWCSFDPEPGRWADQRYLQDWPQRFDGVRVTDHVGIGPAPWNAAQHRIHEADGEVLVDDRALVFYHYSGLRLSEDTRRLRLLARASRVRVCSGRPALGWAHPFYKPGPTERDLVWEPYVRGVRDAISEVRRLEPGLNPGLVSPWDLFRTVLHRPLRAGARWLR